MWISLRCDDGWDWYLYIDFAESSYDLNVVHADAAQSCVLDAEISRDKLEVKCEVNDGVFAGAVEVKIKDKKRVQSATVLVFLVDLWQAPASVGFLFLAVVLTVPLSRRERAGVKEYKAQNARIITPSS